MINIELKKEEAAFYFNQANLNISGLDEVIEKQLPHIGSKKENAKKAIDKIFDNITVLKKVENFVFYFKDVAKNERVELDALLLKLIDLRNFYSHYVHNDNVKILSDGEETLLEKYYQIAIEATGSKDVKLEIIDNEKKLTDAGILFLLCMFLKKSQANKLISSISGFKRNDKEWQPRRNLFTYYSLREGYKVVPDMEKHFLLFTLVNHLSTQDENIENTQPSDDIGRGLFFHRIASTFLNISGIFNNMEFYPYQSNRLKERRGDIAPDKDSFAWIEPFQGNSYFKINGYKGVIGENELKELCFAVLLHNKSKYAVEQIEKFLKCFKEVQSKQEIIECDILDECYFPANYLNQPETKSLKEKLLSRITGKINYSFDTAEKAFDKMKDVMEFINGCLPSDEKLKRKDYSRYLKMVRFWGGEKDNIKREFEGKKWTRFFPSELWHKRTLEDVYKFALKKNKKRLEELKVKIEGLNEDDLLKYQKVNNIKNLENLRLLAHDLDLSWREKDWGEYSGQIKKQISDNQKLTIMKQRVIAELKKKHGIENINLRISLDSNKSIQAVLNRIAIPKGFIKRHVLHLQENEKTSRKIREAKCKILLSKKYEYLSRKFLDEKNFDKLTQINGLYEKNRLIAFMVIYLLKQLGLELKNETKLIELKKTRVKYKISDKVAEDIPLSHYPSLVYAMSRKYVDNIDNYEFPDEYAKKAILDKVDIIENQRMEFIKQVLGFEKYLFDNNIIDKSKFTDVETHISFVKIHDELIEKGWDTEKLSKLKHARNKALHGEIPGGTSFEKAKLLINELKK